MPVGSSLPPSVDPSARNRRLVVGLVVVNIAVGALLAVLVSLVAGINRAAYQTQARDNAVGIAAIAQANIGSELTRVDALMQAALDELERLREAGPLREADINRVLEAHRRLLPEAEGLRMTDARGQIRWGNAVPDGTPIDISDRGYFIETRAQTSDHPVFAGPLQSRVTGHWFIGVARPVRVKGRFEGMLYATFATTHFEHLFAQYDVERSDAVTLRRTDMRLVARFAPGSPVQAEPGSLVASPELKTELQFHPDQGVFVSATAFDHVERTTAYHRVEGWPLIAFAGISNDRFFAPWRMQRRHLIELAAVAWLLFVGATLSVYGAGRRERLSLRALAAQTRRAQTLLRVAGDGIHIVDQRGLITSCSDSFATMLGTTREAVIGRHIGAWDVDHDRTRIDAWLANAKDGDRQSAETQYRRGDGSVLDVELVMSVAEIGGELFVYGSARDITERKRMLAAIEASSAEIMDLYDNAPCGYQSVDANGVFVHMNKTMLDWLGCTADEVIGRMRLPDLFAVEDRALFEREFARLKVEGRLEGVEGQIVPRRGPPRRVRISVTSLRDAKGDFLMSRGVVQDVSAQYEARQQVAAVMREQTAMLDNDIVCMAKLKARTFLWKNRALERCFGYGPGELDGQSIRPLYPDQQSYDAVGAEAYPLLNRGEQYRTQRQMRRKDGELIWVDLSSVHLGDEQTLWTMVDITAVKLAQERAEHIAFHDALTGLPNRLLLADRMRQAIAVARRTGKQVAVCYLDLDGFKQVNDVHGHDAGDELLVEIGHRLAAALRTDDTAARVGGDEFVVLLTMIEHRIDWEHVVERLVKSISAPIPLACGAKVSVGTSVGVALAPNDGVEASALLTKADQAMLRAKRAGKGRVELATSA